MILVNKNWLLKSVDSYWWRCTKKKDKSNELNVVTIDVGMVKLEYETLKAKSFKVSEPEASILGESLPN